MSALATIAGKSFNCKFIAKFNFLIRYFMLPLIADADIGSLKSLHALFDNLEHMLVKFEQKSYGPNYTKF